jgi:peptide-methionine (R)-S-oxide reductase
MSSRGADQVIGRRHFILGGTAVSAASICIGKVCNNALADSAQGLGNFEIVRTDEEWRRELSRDQYAVLRSRATERPWSSLLNKESRLGTYVCAGCGLPLFSSNTKFESGTGWPSFWTSIAGSIGISEDRDLFLVRTEVHCRRCGGHLGHVFKDGPEPTGLRYCMNGIALNFVPD